MQNFSVWDVSFLTSFNSCTDLVRHNQTGQLMLRRISSRESLPVMQMLSAIRHPNLMTVYAACPMDGKCVSMCEFINGVTPEALVEQNGPFAVTEAKNIICQLCEGLTALHINGIVHRDVKPSNVMITPDGTVKLIDFDISRIVKPEQSRDTTTMGTAGYAPPEQFGFAQTGARADIYSCGVLLNYLLTGRLPTEQLYQGALTTVILRCIEIDEANRFKSAAELRLVLLGKKPDRRRRLRALPGFRGKHVFPKILTVILMILWFLIFLVYADPKSTIYQVSSDWTRRQLVFGVTVLFFWSALPYFLFGDIFRLSEKINPDNPQNGKYVLRILGTASFVIGFILLLIFS